MNILTVDDTSTARLIVKKCFEPLGHTLFEAENGQVALEVLATQGAVDLVLLDWNMPVMDGFTCLTEIRKKEDYKDVKIIMCTTEAEKTQVLKAIGIGANGYLIKPVTADTMKEIVAKVVGDQVLQNNGSEFESQRRQEREAIRQAGKPTMPDEQFLDKYVQPFVTSLQDLFESILKARFNAGPPVLKDDAVTGFAVSGTMVVSGKVSGRVVVSLSERAATECTQKYLQLTGPPEQDLIADAAGEFANIVVGKATNRVFGERVAVPIPLVVFGPGYAIAPQKGVACVAVPCKSELGDLELTVGITGE